MPKLKKWYQSLASSEMESMRCLTQKMNRDNAARDCAESKASNLNLIKEISETIATEIDMDKQNWFFLNGYVAHIKNDERLSYPACPNENCRRKVVEDSNGFRCENCQKTHPAYNPTYMATVRISDFTDSIYVSFLRDQGTAILGKTAQEMETFRQTQDPDTVQEYFDSLMFKKINLMVKGKYETYQNEPKMKFVAMKTFPRSVAAENKSLLERLDIYSTLEAVQ